MLPYLLRGALLTLEIVSVSIIIGVSLGTLVGLGRISRNRWLSAACATYTEVLRGTPLLVQLWIVFFGLPQVLKFNLNEFVAGFLAFGINSSAYVSEIIRAGIQSIDRGQMEAARSLGMPYVMAMRFVILPQAFKRVIPPLWNEFISLLKNSSLVATISVEELLRRGQLIATRTFRPMEMYLAVSAIYLVMTLALSQVAVRLERRLGASD